MNETGVSFQQHRSYTKKELQEIARIRGIDLFQDKEIIKPVWQGQPTKGLLQALWEQGLIDQQALDKYTLDGRKDPITGVVDLQYSLKHLLSECTDFKEEETALQYLGTQLGVTVDLTPKFHAELAGEGIEYNWAHAKSYYRRVPVSRKKGRENFKALVRECTSPAMVLTKGRVQKFAARARAYICTYFYLEQIRQTVVLDPNVASLVIPGQEELLYPEIQRLQKFFKTHRAVFDFDRGFVNAVLKEDETKMEDQSMEVI